MRPSTHHFYRAFILFLAFNPSCFVLAAEGEQGEITETKKPGGFHELTDREWHNMRFYTASQQIFWNKQGEYERATDELDKLNRAESDAIAIHSAAMHIQSDIIDMRRPVRARATLLIEQKLKCREELHKNPAQAKALTAKMEKLDQKIQVAEKKLQEIKKETGKTEQEAERKEQAAKKEMDLIEARISVQKKKIAQLKNWILTKASLALQPGEYEALNWEYILELYRYRMELKPERKAHFEKECLQKLRHLRKFLVRKYPDGEFAPVPPQCSEVLHKYKPAPEPAGFGR